MSLGMGAIKYIKNMLFENGEKKRIYRKVILRDYKSSKG